MLHPHLHCIVYAKRPFGGPKQVIEYLGRYTHKVAISNHRLQKLAETTTLFSYKDNKTGGIKKTMLHKCPCCKTGKLIIIESFGIRGPPEKYLLKKQIAAV